MKLDLHLLDKLKPKYNMKAKATNCRFQRNYWIVLSKSKSFYWKREPLQACQCSSIYEHLQQCTAMHMTFNHSALYKKHPTVSLPLCILFSFFLSPSHASQLESDKSRLFCEPKLLRGVCLCLSPSLCKTEEHGEPSP